MPNSVLIVEDNQDMRTTLDNFLSSNGLNVISVSSTEEGIDEVDENEFDIGIIDINLPGKSGFEMIEYIREQGKDIPLMAMTARDGIDDKLRGFNLGLTDYIVKPFDIKELHARLMVHLKNSGNQDNDQPIKKGDFDVNPNNLKFKYKGSSIELTQLEFRIMYLLVKNADTMVKIDDLIEFAWGESEEIINPPIRIHIANLRKKIGDDSYEIIKTVPGSGYILNIKG